MCLWTPLSMRLFTEVGIERNTSKESSWFWDLKLVKVGYIIIKLGHTVTHSLAGRLFRRPSNPKIAKRSHWHAHQRMLVISTRLISWPKLREKELTTLFTSVRSHAHWQAWRRRLLANDFNVLTEAKRNKIFSKKGFNVTELWNRTNIIILHHTHSSW